MTRLPVNLSALALLFFALPSLYAADHQVSLDYSQSENYVGSNDPLTRMKPALFSLAYGMTFDRRIGLNLSYWMGEDEATYPDSDYVLEQESEGGSISVSWYLEEWSLNAVASQSKTDNTLTSPTRPARADQVQKFREFYVSVDYTWQLGELDLRPELGVGLQKSESDSRLNIELSNLKQLDTERQEDDGKYLQVGLSLAYWLEQGPHWLWQPALSLFWIDPLSGNSQIAQQRSVRFGRNNGKASNTSEEDSESDASGFADLSLSVYFQDISLTAYYSRSLDIHPDTETMGISAGLSF